MCSTSNAAHHTCSSMCSTSNAAHHTTAYTPQPIASSVGDSLQSLCSSLTSGKEPASCASEESCDQLQHQTELRSSSSTTSRRPETATDEDVDPEL
eukprot:2725789-Karenia_brevis.AAC.1